MRKLALVLCCWIFLQACDTKPAETAESKPLAPVQIGDPKFQVIGKATMDNLSKGDIAAMVTNYSENSLFRWSSGDSLLGRSAIEAYWKDRRANVIDSLIYLNEIWLPIEVNQPQTIESPGNWILAWHRVKAKYKNGQTVNFWVHTDMHFDNNDKIDQTVMYYDRAPINAVTTAKK